jgi:hypothetical protein
MSTVAVEPRTSFRLEIRAARHRGSTAALIAAGSRSLAR